MAIYGRAEKTAGLLPTKLGSPKFSRLSISDILYDVDKAASIDSSFDFQLDASHAAPTSRKKRTKLTIISSVIF
jgi:hypothetical protein